MENMTDFDRKILEGCRAIAPRAVQTGDRWHAAAKSLAAHGLLREHEHPHGDWPSYSITPEGLLALKTSNVGVEPHSAAGKDLE